MRKPSRLELIFIAYLAILFLVFTWGGISGTRLLGDGKEAYEPEGKPEPRDHSRTNRSYRIYHK